MASITAFIRLAIRKPTAWSSAGFNGRISDLVAQTRFASAAELDTTLKLYLRTYNHNLP